MKKYLFILAVFCLFAGQADAADLFADASSFTIARATKLGRVSTGSLGGMSSVGGKAETEQYIECDANCTACDTKSGSCSKCVSGRYLKNNLCISCPANAVCTGGSSFTCKTNFRKAGEQCPALCEGVSCKSGFSPTVKSGKCCCE